MSSTTSTAIAAFRLLASRREEWAGRWSSDHEPPGGPGTAIPLSLGPSHPPAVSRGKLGGARGPVAASVLAAAVLAAGALPARGDGQLRLTVEDESGNAVPARIVVTNERGRERSPRGAIEAGVGVAVDGEADLRLNNGTYKVEFSRGPEYRRVWGTFTIESDAEDAHAVQMERIVTMAEEGWISGDPLVSDQMRRIELQMAAEDLHVAGVFSAHPQTAESARDAAAASQEVPAKRRDCYVDDAQQPALLAYGTSQPIAELSADQPRSDFVRAAIEQNAVGIVIADPTVWELPILLASERISGFMVLGPHVTLGEQRRRKTGRPPARRGYLNEAGPGRWAEYVYWQVLEAGLPIPAVAGSGTPDTANPIGYNRCYVARETGSSSSQHAAADWWQGLRQGRCVITNGPLLRPRVDRMLPGHRFHAGRGQSLSLQPECQLAVRDPVDYLEIVQNGAVMASPRLAELAENRGRLPTVPFEQSGWMLIRCVTQTPDHYRMAMSSPWWVDIAGAPRIKRSAVQFFQQWLEDYVDRAAQWPPERRDAIAPYIHAARRFWAERLDAATVE